MALTPDHFVIHPEFGYKKDGSANNADFALIKLPHSVQEAQKTHCGEDICATKVCLPRHKATPGAACWVAGWGLDDYDNDHTPLYLQTVGVNIFSKEYTKSKLCRFHQYLSNFCDQ